MRKNAAALVYFYPMLQKSIRSADVPAQNISVGLRKASRSRLSFPLNLRTRSRSSAETDRNWQATIGTDGSALLLWKLTSIYLFSRINAITFKRIQSRRMEEAILLGYLHKYLLISTDSGTFIPLNLEYLYKNRSHIENSTLRYQGND